ncbi:hypothetical protein IW261DRAFT_1568221 [Armillaria novae-zelandiae]|uniref:Uncharacterized protein n=1 Tax=Armillaria novae-zelandiae TaxID=153914 RepID=A0AA39UE43_9AGAR|nr:hypothetical protein IW261DRAFT_1568221 [Armillaria novae-zelandiae]
MSTDVSEASGTVAVVVAVSSISILLASNGDDDFFRVASALRMRFPPPITYNSSKDIVGFVVVLLEPSTTFHEITPTTSTTPISRHSAQ